MNKDISTDSDPTITTMVLSVDSAIQNIQTPPASYNSLPKELKLDIWDQAHRDAPERVIPIRCSPIKPWPIQERITGRIRKYLYYRLFPASETQTSFPPALPEHWEAFGPTDTFFSSTRPYSDLYYVDRVSREVAMKKPESLFPRNSVHKCITVNLSRDILLLSPRPIEISIAPALKRFLTEISPEQKHRLRYAALECVLTPRLWNLPVPSFESSIAEYLYTEMYSCLEMVALIAGCGKEGNILGEGNLGSTLELVKIIGDFYNGHKARCPLRLRTTQDNVVTTVKYHCTTWRVRYAAKAPGDESPTGKRVELFMNVFCRAPGQILTVWNSERNAFDTRVVGTNYVHRAKGLVRKIARHYADIANEQRRLVQQ